MAINTQSLNEPPKNWQKFGNIHWQPSDLTPDLFQAMINIGEGITLCVEAGGNADNPPILLIMGLGSQMVFWPDEFIYRLINAGFFVIRFDNRDIGLSSKIQITGMPHINQLKMMLRLQLGVSNRKQPVAYNLVDMAEDTARLIKSLNLKKTHVIGASMGGMIAQILSARYPNRIDRLTLLFSTNNRAFLQPPKPKQFYTLIKRPESHSEHDIIRHSVWFMNTVGSPGHVNIKQVRKLAKIRYQRCFHPLGVIQQLNAILATGSIVRFSKKIKAPTIIIHGSQDGFLPPSHGKVLAKTIPNSQFYLIDGMGHDLPSYFQPYLVQLIKNHCFGR